MADKPITIVSVCQTAPDQHVHVNMGDRVRWHADHDGIYVLWLKGGFFKGEPSDFHVWVISTNWTKDYIVEGKGGTAITNYIYDLSGKNCLPKTADGPPDIIIDSTLKPPKRPGSSKKEPSSPKKKK
jgi:hypothetical protein